jgi:hypothetical protein
MPFRIDHTAADGVIRIVFSGPVYIEDRARALREILEGLSSSGSKFILVDFRAAWLVAASAEASDRHAANLAREYQQWSGARIAYLSGPEDRRPASPVEQLAAMRGYYYQRFTDEGAAMRWLGSASTQ